MHGGLSAPTGALVCGIVGFPSMAFSGLGHELGHDAAPDLITVDGQTGSDIGLLPTTVSIPPTNFNYAAKISLGKQLYLDGQLYSSPKKPV